MLLSWARENYIFPKGTKMGSIFDPRIDYSGEGVQGGQQYKPPEKLTKVTPNPHPWETFLRAQPCFPLLPVNKMLTQMHQK